ncbi:FAD-dependent oxidoreductase [bacterium]|jgi:electron transfer flavoprotein-quinone oxidoreductase|nr:FAD-dependent oxidoreductase [bacterium]
MEEEKFDCIIVGGGVAGTAAAYVLAQNGAKILLVEKGEWTGSKNVSGGVIWGPTVWEIFPELINSIENPPYERFINRRRLSFMSEASSFSIDFHSEEFSSAPYNGVSVLRSRFDKWLGEQVEEAIAASDYAEDSLVATSILVDELVNENGRVCGIRCGEDIFYSDSVILAEGVNNLLTRSCGLMDDSYEAELVGTGIKEVWQFDRDLLESRFQLEGRSGVSNEFVGCTEGVEGGGFVYTNLDTISIGLVLGLKTLRDSGKAVYDILDSFKAHPSIKPILQGGKMVEYSAHVVPVGDIRLVPKQLYKDGVLVVGDAAGLLMNTGKSIEGMNLAMESGRQAALAVLRAKKQGDFSSKTLGSYQESLAQTFVLKDMNNFQGAVKFLHQPAMFKSYPNLVNQIMKNLFVADGEPKRKTRQIIQDCISESDLSYWDVLKTSLWGGAAL